MGIVNSAHDVSEGGLTISLLESVITGEDQTIGCEVVIPIGTGMRIDFLLFGEEQGRILVSANPDHRDAIEKVVQEHKIEITILGKVTGFQRLKLGNILAFHEW